MLKPNSLRKALTDAVPVLQSNPAMLRLFIDCGTIAATLAASLSYEKHYTLRVEITDFTDDIDVLLAPVMAWLRENQPDIFTIEEKRQPGFSWCCNEAADGKPVVCIRLKLTERTQVSEVDGGLHVQNLPEPPPPQSVSRPVALYIRGELVSAWGDDLRE